MVPKNLNQSCFQVAVVLDISGESARGIMRGILRFVRENVPWNITYISSSVSNVDSSTLKSWRGDGIITRVTREETFRQILAMRCPAILLSEESYPIPPRCRHQPVFVRCEDFSVGQMAAEYFLSHDLRSFAIVPNNVQHAWSRHRCEGFTSTLEKAGFKVSEFPCSSEWKIFTTSDWLAERKKLVRWLLNLPKPVGILAANDFRGRQVLEACQLAGIPVPYQASVLGVNNDELVCQMSYPSLSSIVVDWEKAGYIAASALQARMTGATLPRSLSYGPLKVISRGSTDRLQVADPLVVKILETIRINHGQNLRVNDIARMLKVPVRTAQLRFRNAVGHTIIDEIKSVRMRFVCDLLTGTDLTIAEIARRCGFENSTYLTQAFRQEFGMTMTQWRGNGES